MFSSGITSINLILIQSNINETSAESHPLNTLALQLVHKTQLLTDYSFKPKNIIKEIDKNLKDSHDESLKIQFDLQNKLQCYSTLNRTTTSVNDLLIQPFKERQILSKYRVSDHDLEIERERHRQTWSEREQGICRHWSTANRGRETLSDDLSQISQCEGNISPRIWSPDPFIYWMHR